MVGQRPETNSVPPLVARPTFHSMIQEPACFLLDARGGGGGEGEGRGRGGGGGGELLYRQLTRVPREHIPRTLCLLNRPYAMAKVIVADT